MNRVVMEGSVGDAYLQPHGADNNANNAAPEQSMICMSVVEDGPRIAFCAYNEQDNRIILDVCVSNGFEVQSIVERVLAVVRPTLLLVSNKIVSNDKLLEILTISPSEPQAASNNDETEAVGDDGAQPPPTAPTTANLPTAAGSNTPRSIPYRLLKTAAFDVKNCKAIILQKLKVRSLMKQATAHGGGGGGGGRGIYNEDGRQFPRAAAGAIGNNTQFRVASYHALATLIDFESPAQVQAVGSLLSFLQSTIFRLEEGGCVTVSDIVQARASMYMNLSSVTLSALHVFATEHHPLVAKGAGNAKEGGSLFSLLDRTQSRAGRNRLKEWMLKPLLDLDAIAMRQDGVELFMLPELQTLAGTILKLLHAVGAVDQILVRIQKCCTKPSDFIVLSRSLTSADGIIGALEEILWNLRQAAPQNQVPGTEPQQPTWDSDPQSEHYICFLEALMNRCNRVALQQLNERVVSVVNTEATNEIQAVVIERGYSEHLDDTKDQYLQLTDTLHAKGREMQDRLPHLRGLLGVLFIPQVGFLICLREHSVWRAEGKLPEDFTFIFKDDEMSYFKNEDVSFLDDDIGDLDGIIKDAELMIVAELEDDILECEPELRDTFDVFGDLDCILSFASTASDCKYARPEVVPALENCINILNGRHPLQEIIIDGDFIPNNSAVNATDRVNIITGPNFSGKSCYARQVGLLVYMAHIGCFVPCDAARISVTEQILARFSTAETCAVPQSSFQLDLSQMGNILRRSNANTLVIIDEFGKGTSPASGIALLTAALQKLGTANCKVLCTTHFLEIFSMGLLRDGENGIKALRMAVQVPKTTEDIAAPLFKLEEGVASSSAGLVCAKMAGVKDAVIERATEVVHALRGRHQVQPLAEILRSNLHFTPLAKSTLGQFVSTNWEEADDEELNRFLAKVDQM